MSSAFRRGVGPSPKYRSMVMAKKKGALHLRLIFEKETGEASTGVGLETPEQISFPFPSPDGVPFILALVATMNRGDFIELVNQNMSAWVIDVRVAPRFDTLVCSREAAFRLFREQNVTYVDLFGRLDVKSYRSAESNPALWGNRLCNLLTESKRGGPYVALFDNHSLMMSAGNVLPPMVQGALGEDIHFHRIGLPPESSPRNPSGPLRLMHSN